MIHDLFLRWIVTGLFVLSAAECVFALATGHRAWTHAVGHVLHLVMAVAMAVMAWPKGAALPTIAPMVFFLLATGWFVIAAFAGVAHRLINGYHALMMFAMAWMYAVMNGSLLPGQQVAHHDAGPASPVMAGMDMSGSDVDAAGMVYPAWIAAIDWFWTIGFALATLWWINRYFVDRQAAPTLPSHRHFGVACQAMMAAGMAIMFGVML
ncbi:DUF5134 domain-containing protein [Mycolicibacterium sp. P9-64]|uniref:DUF5134 domain-containing protein n=1 Tax=Mycolicibacterium sp. P9-64 TaxID=2024612 RepID=UPI0011EF7527|nr:DUF5134 domain-containing protein [Mycolicibacterium sp. P9-64]KAA0080801.1 DUF5134 domain-containing protein [Mycolicibacterium sp. P9-64]